MERLDNWEEMEELIREEPSAMAESMNMPLREMTDLARLRQLDPWKNPRYTSGDLGNGNLYADFFRDTQRYVSSRKCWYHYDGRVWQADPGRMAAYANAKYLVKLMGMLAAEVETPEVQQAALKRVQRLTSLRARGDMVSDACSAYPAEMAQFDQNPWLFNCENGTLELDTLTFREHRAEDLITRLAPVCYDPEAQCPRWDQFVTEVLAVPGCDQLSLDQTADPDPTQGKKRFVQKALGYALTGDTRYECLFILYGRSSRNGKSTMMETVSRMMGDYAVTARPETFTERPGSGSAPNEDVARLAGRRLVSVAEGEGGMRLSASLVKRATGNDTLTARFLHENSFQFQPVFKLFMNTNHLPLIADQTLFLSGRVKLIPFERHFTPAEQDPALKGLFARRENQSAVLNWCVEGLRMLKEEGLTEPECMKNAVDTYRADCDWLEEFLQEHVIFNSGARTRVMTVYDRYRLWCERSGMIPENAISFRRMLGEKRPIRKMRPEPKANATAVLFDHSLR